MSSKIKIYKGAVTAGQTDGTPCFKWHRSKPYRIRRNQST